jgi:hypothetical protein
VRLLAILRVELAIPHTIVLAMTVKPKGDDVWPIVIVAVILAALMAFLTPLRSQRAAA